MDRRSFLSLSIGGLALLAGCSGDSNESESSGSQDANSDTPSTDSSTATDTTTNSPTDTSTETSTPTETETPTETDTPTETPTSSYQVRISYDGEWSGSIGGGGSTRSVDGTGTRTFDIEGDPFIVSANAQKGDDGAGTLTVQILENGDVIAQRTTSAAYGLAQVTSEDDIQTESEGGGSSDSSSFEVRIEYSGQWQGSIAQGGSSRSVDGSGTETFAIDGDPDIITANAQKQDDSSETLTIQILEDGEVVEETSTSAEYGLAQVSYSSF